MGRTEMQSRFAKKYKNKNKKNIHDLKLPAPKGKRLLPLLSLAGLVDLLAKRDSLPAKARWGRQNKAQVYSRRSGPRLPRELKEEAEESPDRGPGFRDLVPLPPPPKKKKKIQRPRKLQDRLRSEQNFPSAQPELGRKAKESKNLPGRAGARCPAKPAGCDRSRGARGRSARVYPR